MKKDKNMTKEQKDIHENTQQWQILFGEALMQLSQEILLSYAQQVSTALAEHPDTMIQYSREQILKIIQEGRAIIVTNSCTKQCNAFAQLHIWKTGDGQDSKPGAIEMRSWLSWSNGNGRLAVQGARDLSAQLFPGIPLCAIVADYNDNAKGKLIGYGGKTIQRPSCIAFDLKAGEAIVPTIAISLQTIK